MEKCKKFIDIYIPITTCNLKCEYCYIAQQQLFKIDYPNIKYDANFIRKALSKERLGGICCFNMCAGGETLALKELLPIVEALVQEGHYIMIVTNGTMSSRFDEFLKLDKSLLKHILFKFSYHYLQLRKKNLLSSFFDNVKKARAAGCSVSVELPASDDFIPYLEEIKNVTIENVGALPHVTVLRDDRIEGRPILTKLSNSEYKQVWESFDSDMFNLRISLWGKKRKEFCYAGYYTGLLNLETGIFRKCNSTSETQNIYNNLAEKIQFSPIGYCCPEKHCYISHAWLTFGCIPELNVPTFYKMRDRITLDGTHWLTDEYRTFLDIKLSETNGIFSKEEKAHYNRAQRCNVKKILQNIFSITNSTDRRHKNIKLLGTTISIKKRSK